MSREFHDVPASYLWEVMANTASDRPITGEPMADAIRGLLIALAPIEYEVASHQAGDRAKADVVLAASEHRQAIEDAAARLVGAARHYSELVARIVRDHEAKKGAP